MMTGIGSRTITASEKMLKAAFAYQNAVILMHVPCLIVLSNAYAMGEHWKMLENVVPIVKATTIPMQVHAVF